MVAAHATNTNDSRSSDYPHFDIIVTLIRNPTIHNRRVRESFRATYLAATFKQSR
jgi:hypothetical protein